MKRMLLLLIVLVMAALACGGSSSSTTQATRVPGDTIIVSTGTLRETIRGRSGTVTKSTIINVRKLNGTLDNRDNDLRELCLDFIYYRDQIVKETARGNTSKADDARRQMDRINRWLDAYHEDDVQFMFTLIGEKNW